MRRWTVLVLLSSACTDFGAASTGGARDAEAPDGNATALDAGHPGADASVPSFCEEERKDPKVRLCIDFDDPTLSPPTFGGDFVTSEATQTFQLAPPFVDASGKSLLVGLDGPGAPGAYFQKDALSSAQFISTKKSIIDVDIVVDELSVDYAVLAGFEISGPTGCSLYPGLAVKPSGLHRSLDPSGPSIHPLVLGVPFHFRLVGTVESTATTTEELFIDGLRVAANPVPINATCTQAAVRVGTYFTGGVGRVRARFDRMVLRVE